MSNKIFRFFNKQKEFEQDVLENGMRYSGFYGDSFSLKREADGSLSMISNGKPAELTPVYPWQGMVRKKYTDVYLTAVRDENGKVFGAHYGSRIFPKSEE